MGGTTPPVGREKTPPCVKTPRCLLKEPQTGWGAGKKKNKERRAP